MLDREDQETNVSTVLHIPKLKTTIKTAVLITVYQINTSLFKELALTAHLIKCQKLTKRDSASTKTQLHVLVPN